ncbi:MAG: N-acetylneuraminate synthase family protein [Minisyncoccia bacterium]
MSILGKLSSLLSTLPPRVKMRLRYVGPEEPVFVIAEIGINHNGEIETAKKLIDAAKEAGADAVKFQKRTTTEILTKEGRDKPYTSPHAYAATYGEHRDKLEFSIDQYTELMRYTRDKGLGFFASVWDHSSADQMAELGIEAFKIPSADLTNLPLLEHVAKKNLPILISTGMNTLEEIEDAVHTILQYNNRLIIFHCLSLYPAPEDKLDMRFMDALAARYAPLPYGYSGHEIDLLPTLVAVSRGAQIVERHLTLDKTMKGSDHAASLEPNQFKELVISIRRIEKILGAPEKKLYDELKPLREKLAKSVATRVAIPKGTRIEVHMLTVKGPGGGIAPRDMSSLVGRTAQTDIADDALVPSEALTW